MACGISALPATPPSPRASSLLVRAAGFIRPDQPHIVWSLGYGLAERSRLAAGVDASMSGCTANSMTMNVTFPGYLTPTSRLSFMESCRFEAARGVRASSAYPTWSYP